MAPMRLISVDTSGLRFALALVALATCAVGGYAAVAPQVGTLIGEVRAFVLDAVAAGDTDTRPEADQGSWNIATNLPTEDSGAKPTTSEPPAHGQYVLVNLEERVVAVYEDGAVVYEATIVHVPEEGPDTLAAGTYVVDRKRERELSTVTLVEFPYLVHFDDRYAVHGAPRTREHAVATTTDGSVELADDDARVVFELVRVGAPVYVRADTGGTTGAPTAEGGLAVADRGDLPATSARSYALIDLDTGQMLLEKRSSARYPIASITKLVTAAVASEVLPQGSEIRAPDGQYYALGDLYYPLFLRSDNGVAEAIAAASGTRQFVTAMNAYVHALGMEHTSFADPTGLSPKNVSTAHELVTLAVHLAAKKRFLLDMSSEDAMTITSAAGKRWSVVNQNKLATDPHFHGGKLGFTDEALQTSLALFSLPVEGGTRSVAVAVLGSQDWKQDTRALLRFVLTHARAAE